MRSYTVVLTCMKSVVAIATLLLALAGSSQADGGEGLPFRVGEKLTYQIFWGPFVAGRATLHVEGIDQVDGHDCYHLIARAGTSGLADLLFHVDSTTESWMDMNELFTRRYREHRVEGKKVRNTEVLYDYERHEMTTTNLNNGKTSVCPLDEHVQDVVSALYYVRMLPLKQSVTNKFLINASGSNYPMNICPDLRKLLWVRPVGDVEALRIEPQPTLNIVAANHGRMWFWVSDDSHKLPLLVSSDMKIGSARLVLYKIESADQALPTTNFSTINQVNSELATSSVISR